MTLSNDCSFPHSLFPQISSLTAVAPSEEPSHFPISADLEVDLHLVANKGPSLSTKDQGKSGERLFSESPSLAEGWEP